MAFKGSEDPIAALRREMERLVDEVGKGLGGLNRSRAAGRNAWRGFEPAAPETESTPAIDVVEEAEALEVRIDLPGWDEAEITVELDEGGLVLKGEPAQEPAEAKAAFHLKERRRGPFARRVVLPVEVDAGRAEARFAKGVLAVRLPKAPSAKRQRIHIKRASVG